MLPLCLKQVPSPCPPPLRVCVQLQAAEELDTLKEPNTPVTTGNLILPRFLFPESCSCLLSHVFCFLSHVSILLSRVRFSWVTLCCRVMIMLCVSFTVPSAVRIQTLICVKRWCFLIGWEESESSPLYLSLYITMATSQTGNPTVENKLS